MPRDARSHIPKSKGPRLGRYTVTSAIAPLHRGKSRLSGLETQLLFGHKFDVYEKHGRWGWGQSSSPLQGSKQRGYVGFVPLKDLDETDIRANYVVSALKAPMFSKKDIKSPIVKCLPLGALVKISRQSKNFAQTHQGEFIHVNHIRKRNEEPLISDFVTIAESHLGLPYIWGGVSTQGLDCSGLVQSSLRASGVDAPRDADMQQAELGRALPLKQSGLKRGDLIFWKGHVGIMMSSRQMIHANAYHMMVATEPLREAARRILENSGGAITAVKRL